MISIDTNILVHLFTGDDKEQAARAKRLFLDEHIYIIKTVILETEWGYVMPMLFLLVR